MHTSLLTSGLAVAALASVAGAQSFSYPDFSSVAGLNLQCKAVQAGTVLTVIDNVAPASGSDNRGSAWYSAPIAVANGFDTTFTYRMHSPSTTGGGDGMAFLIHNDQIAGVPCTIGGLNAGGNTALGRHAAAGGWGVFANSLPGESVDNSLAIQLDTYNNGASWGDVSSNMISVNTGGSGDNSQHAGYSLGRSFPATNLNDGLSHTVRVLYVPGTLEVYLDGALQVSVPYDFNTGGTWVDSATAVAGLSLMPGGKAYVGFSAGNGGARQTCDVEAWDFASGGGPGTAFCFGDGSGTLCPCGNAGGAGEGCANSSGAGAALAAGGTDSALADDLTFAATGLLPGQPALLFAGLNAVNGGAGNVFGDGLRGAGGGVVRLGVRVPDASGGASWGPGLGAAGGWTAGDTRRFQGWYRDPSASPCGSAFNLTSGYEVTFN